MVHSLSCSKSSLLLNNFLWLCSRSLGHIWLHRVMSRIKCVPTNRVVQRFDNQLIMCTNYIQSISMTRPHEIIFLPSSLKCLNWHSMHGVLNGSIAKRHLWWSSSKEVSFVWHVTVASKNITSCYCPLLSVALIDREYCDAAIDCRCNGNLFYGGRIVCMKSNLTYF